MRRKCRDLRDQVHSLVLWKTTVRCKLFLVQKYLLLIFAWVKLILKKFKQAGCARCRMLKLIKNKMEHHVHA
jgi:hypothetical protein